MNAREVTTPIRRSLRYAWRPFFGRFGRLTPVQIETIPHVLAGTNVVVMAPTASGKTEAVAAPVAERHRHEGWDGLAVIYVVPTRALANDTLIRVGGPVSDMGYRVDLKHSDRPYLPADLNWLITTPESLDSLICRHSDRLQALRTLILDEIHVLDNTYRGDHLRILLARLRRLTDAPCAIHLISATLADPEDIASRYTNSAKIIAVGGQRSATLHHATTHQDVKNLARDQGWKKILYFCNKRETVESVAADLEPVWKPYPVVAHHGSLNRAVRQEAEQVLRESRVAVGVATATLEVGIDIGDIDLIVLAEPPWSVSALMQRIGRGNRRSQAIQVVALSHEQTERQVLDAMFTAATDGQLEQTCYTPDLSVAVQQIFSIVFQARGSGVDDDTLISLLSGLVSATQGLHILTHLQHLEWLERSGRHWYASTRLMSEAEIGLIHSNIPDSTTYRVIDVDSNRDIGTIAGVVDQVFLLGREAWQIIDMRYPIIRVRRYRGKADPAIFKRHHQAGRYARLLPADLRHVSQ